MESDVATSGDERSDSPVLDRHGILSPAIKSVVTALGGFEASPDEKHQTYKLGDSCYGCLKDLKRFWRKDDTDDDRTVARIFWSTRVLIKDLIPILLETVGKGDVEDRCGIACADLITAMTWPIDLSEELKELDDQQDTKADYTVLFLAQISYKAALLQPGVLKALFSLMLPPLAKDRKQRTERDVQIINVVLHGFRNLAFIKDPPARANSSADQIEHSSLQSKLLVELQKHHVFDLFLTLASNANDPSLNNWNGIVLEIFYLVFRGVKPSALVKDQQMRPREDLSKLLAAEEKGKREDLRKGNTRHSRFGTTIGLRTGKESYVLHKQQALTANSSTLMDLSKKKKFEKAKKMDDLATFSELNVGALTALQGLANGFMENCFNVFLSSLLKDIKAERARITEKDNLRLLFVGKWFLEFYTALRAKEVSERQGSVKWGFDYIAEVMEREWLSWVLRRMREAVDNKPRQWVELQAGMDCLTQVLLIIDLMSHPSAPEEAQEVAQNLQHQLYYNGEVFELTFEGLKSYKEQSIAYLDSSIHLAYILLRTVEKWGTSKSAVYVKKRSRRKKKRGKVGVTEEEGVVDVGSEDDSEDDANDLQAQRFEFEKYEAKFADEDIAQTCIAYLARYQEFDSPEKMKRTVGLLHRQAVKAKAEGLFFRVSTLNVFSGILERTKSLPKDQAYKDLISLINYVLKKFFKALAEDPLLMVEAFFPKNRGQWKRFSTFEEPIKKSSRGVKAEEKVTKRPAEVTVKKGHSWSNQLGIAIACLVDDDKRNLVDWLRAILSLVSDLRKAVVDEIDGEEDGDASNVADLDGADVETRKFHKRPSEKAMKEFKEFYIPYSEEEYADAATNNPHLKLAFRLVKFSLRDDEADEYEWFVPSTVIPEELQRSLSVIDGFLANPIDLDGKSAADELNKKAKSRKRTRPPVNEGGDDDDLDGAERNLTKRKEKKQREDKLYKSHEMIEDSDFDDPEKDVEFYKKEKALRERAVTAADTGKPSLMLSTGTKKRKKSQSANIKVARRRKAPGQGRKQDDEDEEAAEGVSDDSLDVSAVFRPAVRPRRRVAPAPEPAGALSDMETPLDTTIEDDDDTRTELAPPVAPQPKPRRRNQVVISDEDE